MPEPEQLGVILLSLGAAVVCALTGAVAARVLWMRRRAAGIVAGAFGCLVAAVIGLPGGFFLAGWGHYWLSRPRQNDVRLALPGTWQGTGRWSGDRLVVTDDLKFLQTIESPGQPRNEVRGSVLVSGHSAGFSPQLWVPSRQSLSHPEAPIQRELYGDAIFFRLVWREKGSVLILQNPGDQPYEL